MNLSRAIAAIPSKNRSLFLSLSLFQSSNLSTTATKPPRWHRKPKLEPSIPAPDSKGSTEAGADAPPAPIPPPPAAADWPRPAEIPWQPKVANSVHLIGSVAIPVQLDVAPDGRFWAVSVMKQEKTADFPQLWIPMVFEGDLAQIAACHLKENDLVYITGQISGEPPPFNIEQRQTSIQVMVHDISYVKKSWMMKKPLEQNELASSRSENSKKNIDNEESLWKDLIANPDNWRDHRMDKKNGLVKPRFPDFKHKSTGRPLWLGSAPEWIKSEHERVAFDVDDVNPKQESNEHTSPAKISDGGNSRQMDIGVKMTWCKESKESNLPKNSYSADKAEASWKDLLENPNNWWDNRSTKFNPKSPDFKHKVTGEISPVFCIRATLSLDLLQHTQERSGISGMRKNEALLLVNGFEESITVTRHSG
ncbi:hypothetical protein AAC387_Pa04g0565 [Persea americana]